MRKGEPAGADSSRKGRQRQLIKTYRRIGQRIRADVLGGERAEYGKRVVAMLSRQLTQD